MKIMVVVEVWLNKLLKQTFDFANLKMRLDLIVYITTPKCKRIL